MRIISRRWFNSKGPPLGFALMGCLGPQCQKRRRVEIGYQSLSATAYPVSKPWKNAWRCFWFESLYRREA